MESVYAPNPTLETVLMVEKAARRYSERCGRYQLWKKLPRKVMYQTYQAALDYLLESNKIIVDKDGKIVWVWDPDGVKRLIKKNLMAR